MKKALLAVMAVALIIGFAGCALWPFGAKSPYLPLKEGNKWEYSGTQKTIIDYPEGIDDIETTINTSMDVEVIEKTETTGEEPIEVWKLKTTSTVDTITSESYGYVDVDKDYIYYYEDLDATEEWYKIPSKPEVGDKWTIEDMIVSERVDPETGDTLFDTTYFKTDYEVVEEGVEAFGDYTDCLKIKATPENVSDYDSYEVFDYWAKDVGSVMTTVKWAATYPYGEETYTMTIEGETKLDSFTEGE